MLAFNNIKVPTKNLKGSLTFVMGLENFAPKKSTPLERKKHKTPEENKCEGYSPTPKKQLCPPPAVQLYKNIYTCFNFVNKKNCLKLLDQT